MRSGWASRNAFQPPAPLCIRGEPAAKWWHRATATPSLASSSFGKRSAGTLRVRATMARTCSLLADPAPVIAVPVIATPLWRVPPSPWANRPEVRRACVPSSGMIGNARSLAMHYAGLLDGRLLPAERVRAAAALQIEAIDVTGGTLARRALGYELGGPLSAQGERLSAFGHGGLGGTAGFADPELGLAFALTKNRLRYDPAGKGVAYAVAEAVRASYSR